MGDAALWRGSSMAVGMAANPQETHQAGRHQVQSHAEAPTGTGKKTMLALNARQQFDRLLVVFPTDVLREQIAGKFETFCVLKSQACLDASAGYPVATCLVHIAGRADPQVQEQMAKPDRLSTGFGQPRQEDLLEYLHSLPGTETAAEDLADLQIRLEPQAKSLFNIASKGRASILYEGNHLGMRCLGHLGISRERRQAKRLGALG